MEEDQDKNERSEWLTLIQACLFVMFCAACYLFVNKMTTPNNIRQCVLDSTKSMEAVRACSYVFK